jgi:hypothetical protein
MPATGAFEAYLDIIPGLDAGVDLTNYRYHLVKMNSGGDVIPCSAAGEAVLGVLQDNPSVAGRGAGVAFNGITKCIAGAAIARGAFVATNASGRAVTASKGVTDTGDTGAAADALKGGYVIGYALTPASANGDAFTLVITNAGVAATTAI